MNQISLGKSRVDAKYFHGAVAGGGAYGPGLCEKIVGMSDCGDLITKRIPIHDNRSGSKRSGSVDYDGVYRAYGYADSNRSEGPEVFFELTGDIVAELSRQQVAEHLRAMSPPELCKSRACPTEDRATRRTAPARADRGRRAGRRGRTARSHHRGPRRPVSTE